MILLIADAPPFTPPVLEADPAVQADLEAALQAAFAATAAFGPWPAGPWRVVVHGDAAAFAHATAAPTGRTGQGVGDTLHLRPWDELRRRDLPGRLRHELAHRRLRAAGLPRWEEEARCLWAETHRRPPRSWPARPATGLQARLDRALGGGTTREQAWAYRTLRAWLAGSPLPAPPEVPGRPDGGWVKEALSLGGSVTVAWPAERWTGPMTVNGIRLQHEPGRAWRFAGEVRFGPEAPVLRLHGTVAVRAATRGWEVLWTAAPADWVAAATDGELGAEAPREARRALAAVLGRWLEGHRRQHPGGRLCPLTHCAVVRGAASAETARAAAEAPRLDVDPRWAFFTGSSGGRALSPREVWGAGPDTPGGAADVPGDRWAAWERRLSAAEVAALKRDVRPGLRPGQAGLRLGEAGPYAVEALRLAAGRRFGWTAWPSNACEGQVQADGSLRLQGRGWGHGVGLCLATARFRAAAGATAEQILDEAFPVSWRQP